MFCFSFSSVSDFLLFFPIDNERWSSEEPCWRFFVEHVWCCCEHRVISLRSHEHSSSTTTPQFSKSSSSSVFSVVFFCLVLSSGCFCWVLLSPNAKWWRTLTRFSRPMSDVVSRRETDFFICFIIGGSVLVVVCLLVIDWVDWLFLVVHVEDFFFCFDSFMLSHDVETFKSFF